MPEGYTEDDVRWLAERINTSVVFTASDGCLSVAQRTKEEIAEQALAALAGAGRLLPGDRKVTVEDEFDWRGRDGEDRIVRYEDYDDADPPFDLAEARARGNVLLGHRRRIVRHLADGSRLVGPWVPVPEPCPTCSPPFRETVGMVCQTCGTDYAPTPSSGGEGVTTVCPGLAEAQVDQFVTASCGRHDAHAGHAGVPVQPEPNGDNRG